MQNQRVYDTGWGSGKVGAGGRGSGMGVGKSVATFFQLVSVSLLSVETVVDESPTGPVA